MSQDIISTNFYDPNVDQVRQSTRQFEDKFPVLLMPLRLETRFMRVDRPITDYQDSEEIEILNLVLELKYLFERMELIGIMERLDTKSLEGRIIEIMDILIAKADDPWTLPWPENEWWEQNRDDVLEAYDILVDRYSSLPQDVREEYEDIATTLTEAVGNIRDFEVKQADSKEFDGAKSMIDKLNRVEDVFDQIINKPSDYTTKTKHRYFNYLDSKTSTIKQVCEDIEGLAMKNVVANTVQINRIKEFTDIYSEKLNQTRSVFSSIPSAFKRNEFLGKYDNELQPGLENFTTVLNEVITPKLEYIQKLKTVKASTMLYQAKRIQFELESVNFMGLSNYQHLRETRKRVYTMLRKFRATGHNIIIGPTKQIDRLKTTWSQADQLLEDFNQLVSQVVPKDRYERAGITRTISHINDNYRADLQGLKKDSPLSSAIIGNSNFIESANAYNTASKKMDELASLLSSLTGVANPQLPELAQASQKMKDFSGEFETLAAKTTIIPEDFFKSIHNKFNDLKQSVDAIANAVQGNSDLEQPITDMNNSAQHMSGTMDQLQSDITDEADPFYDDFRNEIICGDLTETVDELWVRIYPDDIFVNSHEEAVTQDEYDDTAYFWTEVWNADEDKELELAAWRTLTLKYGETRAAYLRQKLNPDKCQQSHSRPSRPAADLKRKLTASISGLEAILSHHRFIFIWVENGMTQIKQDLQDCETLTSSLTEETYDLLNKVVGLTKQFSLKLGALNELVQRHINLGISGGGLTTMLISETYNLLFAIEQMLPQVKVLEDVTMLQATVFPNLPTSGIQIKQSSWSAPPRSDVMPERFVFLGINGAQFTHIKVGNAIPDPLIVGINPSSVESGAFEYDAYGNLMMDENTKWLTDFNEAVEKGMGIIVPLTSTERATGFEKIVVVGVKQTTAVDAKNLLEDLLQAHTFSPDGIGILPIGTPTNNTDKKTSAFSSDDDADKAYERITGDPMFTVTQSNKDRVDGYRLKEALGIDPDLFDRLEHADGQDIYKSLLMNRSMWYGTMGYYMEEIMDTLFTLDNIKRTKYFFNHYVSGRGWLPALRIGTQPYGILPTTAFSRYKAYPNEVLPSLDSSDFMNLSDSSLNSLLQKRFNIRLYKLFNHIREQWMVIVNREQLKIDNFDPSATTAQEHFMNLLGLQATSIEQYYRYNTNTAQRRSSTPDIGSTVNFSSTELYGPQHLSLLFGQFVDQGVFIDDTYYNLEHRDRFRHARIFRLRYHDNFGPLFGPFVRENEDDFLKSIDGLTYIDKLFSTSILNLWDAGSYGDLNSTSLFFMFLRQSLALAYRDAGLDMLDKERVINENTRRRAGSKGTYLIPQRESTYGDIIFTKWDYLFRRPAVLEDMMREEVRAFKRFPLAGDVSKSDLWSSLKGLNWTLANFLYGKMNGHPSAASISQDMSKLYDLRNNFMELKGLPIDELERLFAEHLDLCTYRFDAWQLGLANKRLNVMRTDSFGKEGLYLGAYGWLENLKPDDRTFTTNVPEQLREWDNKPVQYVDTNEGFIHTPSLNHALTAAILRSGYISNQGTGDLRNQMAVNLTSKRVRMGLKLVQGIRNGQETGALLGYQFERALHENYLQQGLEMDQYIYDLRRRFPLEETEDTSGDTDSSNGNTITDDERAIMNVVNGLKLLEAVREELGDALRTAESLYAVASSNANNLRIFLNLPPSISPDRLDAILIEIDEMANAFDALGDLLLSESVYHIAQGNYVRSGAVFAALADGRVPPEVQMINTPRTGHVLTQRVVLQLDPVTANDIANNPVQAKGQHWQSIDFTARSLAEPSLNKWLGSMIGNPAQIRCYVEYRHNDVDHVHLVKLSDLGLLPIDTVYTLSNLADDSSFELNKLIAFYVRTTQGLPVETQLNIHFKDRNDHLIEGTDTLSDDIKTFHEVMPLFSSLFESVTKSRYTTAEDYVIPGEDVPADRNLHQLDVDELKSRLDAALATFNQARNGMESIFNNKAVSYNNPVAVREAYYSPSDINIFRESLLQCAQFGLPNTVPDSAIETSAEAGKDLAKQAAEAIIAMDKKLYNATALINYQDDLADKLKVDKLLEAATILFGSTFLCFPHFTLRNKSEIGQVLTLPHNDGLLRYADEYAMDSWVEGLSKVRTKINKLDMVSTMSRMFNTGFPAYTPVQLPYNSIQSDNGESIGDYWLGLEYPSDYEPENDKLSLVLLNEANLHLSIPNARCCGLLVDEWIEVIPEKEETTGITFNYDQPDAEPPQSLLLAVPPEETGNWEWDDLVHTILDTMDLYKIRLVEPEHIDKSIFTQVLPAVLGEYPAHNKYKDEDEIPNLGTFDLAANNPELNE